MPSFDQQTLIAFLESLIGSPESALWRLQMSIVVLVALWLANRVWVKLLERRDLSPEQQFSLQKTFSYITSVLALILLARFWFNDFRSVATFLGLLSAGLAIALRDPLTNFVGWLFIIWRRPYVVGDRIQIGDLRGDVIDLRIFQTLLLEIGNWVQSEQSTGRILHVPNQRVFTDTIANYTKGFGYIWNEIPVVITFESNWEKAETILRNILERYWAQEADAAHAELKRATRRYYILFPTISPTVYLDVVDNGVRLTMRYMTRARQRRSTAEYLWKEVLRAFAQERDIDLAYPTQRLYFEPQEGKRARPQRHDEQA